MNQTSTALVTFEGIKMYQDLGAAEPGQKWLVVTDAATKAGRTNRCPAMRKALPPRRRRKRCGRIGILIRRKNDFMTQRG